jgi:hypothetical protein
VGLHVLSRYRVFVLYSPGQPVVMDLAQVNAGIYLSNKLE